MKKVKFILYFIILNILISIVFIPTISLAAAQINAEGKNYDTFSYKNNEQNVMPRIASKVFLPKGWKADVPDKFIFRTPGSREMEAKNIVGANELSVPGGLIVTKTTNKSITINWTKVPNAKKYSIQVSMKKDSGFKTKGTTKSTTFTVKGLKKNKIYYIKVRAENGKVKSGLSDSVMGTATTKPSVVTGLTGMPIDAHTILLKWNKAANTTYYEVYASEDDGEFNFIGKTANPGMNVGDLDYDADYCFGIIAYNKYGYTVGDVVYCNTLRYPAPTGLAAQVVEGNKAQLAWNGVSGAQEYDIYYAYDGATVYSYYGSTASSSYTVSGLRENCNCYFAVCANFDGDQSDLSNEAVIKTGYETPGTPSISSASVYGVDYIYLSWFYVSKATDYHIYVSSTAEGPYTLIQRPESSSTYYNIYGIAPSTDYYFKVSAVNHGVEGAQSAYKLVQVSGVPTIMSATEYPYSHEIYLNWYSVAGATGYNIYVSNTMLGTYNYVGSASLTYYDYTGYTANTEYYFCVTSKNDYGESELSDPKYIHTGS